MMRKGLFCFRKKYLLLTVVLFAIELYIGMYVNDDFVRPYFGDFLVVMLLYCFFRSFLNTSVMATVIGVLLLAYAIEAGQYFNIVDRLGLRQHHVLRIVLGSSFEWKDMLVYTVSAISILWVERLMRKNRSDVSGQS